MSTTTTPTIEQINLVVFQSAPYLCLKAIFEMPGKPGLPGLPDTARLFYDKPGELPNLTLAEILHYVKQVFDTEVSPRGNFTVEETDKGCSWHPEYATPGMYHLYDLIKHLVNQCGLGDFHVMAAREYQDAASVQHKMCWADGLGAERQSEIGIQNKATPLKYVIHLAGNGTLKVLNATTCEGERIFFNVPHEEWVATIQNVLKWTSTTPDELVLAYTGMLRSTHPRRHAYAASAIKALVKAFPTLPIRELSEEKEREWENASAVGAAHALLPIDTKKNLRIVNVASGSSTTQLGVYCRHKVGDTQYHIYQGATYDMGIHTTADSWVDFVETHSDSNEEQLFDETSCHFRSNLLTWPFTLPPPPAATPAAPLAATPAAPLAAAPAAALAAAPAAPPAAPPAAAPAAPLAPMPALVRQMSS